MLRGLLRSEALSGSPGEHGPEGPSPKAAPSPVGTPSGGASDSCESVPCRGTCLRVVRDVRFPFAANCRGGPRMLRVPPTALSSGGSHAPAPMASTISSPCSPRLPLHLSLCPPLLAPLRLQPSPAQSASGAPLAYPKCSCGCSPFLLCRPPPPALGALACRGPRGGSGAPLAAPCSWSWLVPNRLRSHRTSQLSCLACCRHCSSSIWGRIRGGLKGTSKWVHRDAPAPAPAPAPTPAPAPVPTPGGLLTAPEVSGTPPAGPWDPVSLLALSVPLG